MPVKAKERFYVKGHNLENRRVYERGFRVKRKPADTKRAENKYRQSAGIYPKRLWEQWEIDFVRGNDWATERELAVALERSVVSIRKKRKRIR